MSSKSKSPVLEIGTPGSVGWGSLLGDSYTRHIKTKIAFATEDLQDAEYISKLLGMRTIRVASNSMSYQIQGRSDSKSYQYQSVPLSRADEVMHLPQRQSLIMRTSHAPVRAEQFIWHDEKS